MRSNININAERTCKKQVLFLHFHNGKTASEEYLTQLLNVSFLAITKITIGFFAIDIANLKLLCYNILEYYYRRIAVRQERQKDVA